MATRLQNGETILFIGDSITDCGRNDPQFRPVGGGYVSYVRDFLAVREPAKSIRVINTGIGGHTIADLRSRWVDDALSHKPDWLSIKIGINDCHRYCTDPTANPLQSPESYAAIFQQLMALTRKRFPKTRLMMIDPFYASLDTEGLAKDSFRAKVAATLPRYIDTVTRMAEQYDARHVKTNELFHAQLKHQHPSVYFPFEPVHPNQTGHMLIAEAVYAALQA